MFVVTDTLGTMDRRKLQQWVSHSKPLVRKGLGCLDKRVFYILLWILTAWSFWKENMPSKIRSVWST